MKRFLFPLAIFVALVVFLAVGLNRNPREVPSPFIGKPAPAFTLPQLHAPEKQLSAADLKGKVWLLNVWASWCAPCRQEHPLLVELQKSNLAPIYGLVHKDQRDAALKLLQQNGDPYVMSVQDVDGKVSIEYGVYGVPETFVIDKEGVVRFKHIGPLTPEALKERLIPLVRQLQG